MKNMKLMRTLPKKEKIKQIIGFAKIWAMLCFVMIAIFMFLGIPLSAEPKKKKSLLKK